MDISFTGVHIIVAGSDIDKGLSKGGEYKESSSGNGRRHGVKQYKGKKGELKAVVSITAEEGRVKPLGSFINKSWDDMEEK